MESPHVVQYGAGDPTLTMLSPHPQQHASLSTTSATAIVDTSVEGNAPPTNDPHKDRGNADGHKKRRQGSTNDILAAVSVIQQIEQQQEALRSEQRKKLRAQDLNLLRAQVVQRSDIAHAQEELVKQHRPRLRELLLLERLPDTCDTLRTLALANNRTVYSFPQLFPLLEASSSMGRFTAAQRTAVITPYDLLATAAAHVPSFVSIFPADDTIRQEMVRINLHAPFAEIRAHVKGLQREALREREALQHAVTVLRVHVAQSPPSDEKTISTEA